MSNTNELIKEIHGLPSEWKLTPVKGKQPYLPKWQKNYVDRGEIVAEIEGGRASGYGLLLGEASGYIAAIDFDGQSAIELGEKEFGKLPRSVAWTSGKPGRYQILFRVPEDWRDLLVNRKVKIGQDEGLEFRYTGNQSVLPPSKHPDTGSYKWVDSPSECEIAELPESVFEFFRDLTVKDSVATRIVKRDREESQLLKSKPIGGCDGVTTIEPIPIARVLAKCNREYLRGVTQGTRDDRGIAIALDLIGVANWIPQIEFDYRGKLHRCDLAEDPYEVFLNYCDGCNPPLSAREADRIWKSAQSYPPEPAIWDVDKLMNCLRGWAKETLPKPERHNSVNRKELHPEVLEHYKKLARELGINLVVNNKGAIASVLNVLKMDLYDLFGSRLEFNRMLREYELDRTPIDINNAKSFISDHLGRDYSTENCILAIHAIASRHQYHPVEEYFSSLPEVSDEHQFVAEEYLKNKYPNLKNHNLFENLATFLLGNPDPLANIMLAKKLIAAVARVLSPGCKDDSLLVLKGFQGAGKSSLLEVLAGSGWFNDDLRDLDSKDELAKLSRYWILELAEVDYLFGKKEVEQFKRFLSATTDTYRPPYGRANIRIERTCAFFATTNKSEFLADPTGDRRYWVVEVNKKIDLEKVKAWRDVIWRLALDAYQAGEKWWLDPEDEEQRSESHAQYRESDPWTEILGDLPLINDGAGEYTTTATIFDRLDIPVERRDRRASNRISKILTELGFAPKSQWDRHRGKSHKVWWRNSSPNSPSSPSDKKIGDERNPFPEPTSPSSPNSPKNIKDESNEEKTETSTHKTTGLDIKNKNNSTKAPIWEKLGDEGELGEVGSESDLHASPSEKKIGEACKLGEELNNISPPTPDEYEIYYDF